ncbi:hypothetical protein [Kitasatospora sp. NPDC098663]|uniref:hypothetical protein n=1 Tax=Kitasatospora sp. NPDC098663 TaxID=3364096 RepID=UPI00382B8CD0
MTSDIVKAKIAADQKAMGTRLVSDQSLCPTKAGKWVAFYDTEPIRVVGLVINWPLRQSPFGTAFVTVREDGSVHKHQVPPKPDRLRLYYTAKATELEPGRRKAIRSLALGLTTQPGERGEPPVRKGDHDYFKSPTPVDLRAWVGTEITAWWHIDGIPGLLTEVTETHAVIWQPRWKRNRMVNLTETTFQRAAQ